MADVLVTGIKIGDMPLKGNVQGDEKLPTGDVGDLAVTPNQIKDYTITTGNLTTQKQLDDAVESIGQTTSGISSRVGNLELRVGNIDTELSQKADADSVYTKDETYMKQEIIALLDNKADKNTVYLKTETYSRSEVYSRLEIDNLLIGLNHQNLTGRSSPNAHPTSAIQDSTGNSQQKINDSKVNLMAKLYGITGDGSNESSKLNAMFTEAVSSGKPVNLEGLTVTTGPLTLTGDVKIVGKGGLKLIGGSNATLINTNFNLEIDGDIVLDQNKAENSGGTVTTESHCTIKHAGDNLILRGVSLKPSTSTNIVTRAKKILYLRDIDVDGGMICLYGIVPTAKVTVIGGSYRSATLYDNITLYNAEDVLILGATSHSSTRSGIVVNNTSKKCRIIGNLSYNNKRDAALQGGWGIVTSINTQDTIVSNNVCFSNQIGGITLDTFPPSGTESTDNRLIVTGNLINGLYNDTYSATGISLNNASHAVVTGNNIYKVSQGIHTDLAKFANITGNIIQDVTGYFLQLSRADNSSVSSNLFDGTSQAANGSLNIVDTSGFVVNANHFKNLTGNGMAVRVSGASKNWLISNNFITRSVAGSSYVFHILGSANTGGIIRNNTVKGEVSGAWQWYVVSDNLADFSCFDNIVDAPSVSYVFQGNAATFGDDLFNGSYNVWATAPTYKSKIGQIAIIASVAKYWNGTVWANLSGPSNSVTYDPPSIPANGGQVTTTVSLTGAAIGSNVGAAFTQYHVDVDVSAQVSSTNVVTVKFRNNGTSAVDLASGTLTVKMI